MKFHGRRPAFSLGALLLVACGGTASSPPPAGDSAVTDITDVSVIDAPAADAPADTAAAQDVRSDASSTDAAVDRPAADAADVAAVCAPMDIGSMIAVVHGDSTGTASHYEGSCGGSDASESVLTWTAPEDGVFTFDTAGTDFDTVLYIFNGNTSCAGAELGCNDDRVDGGEDLTSIVSVRLTAGQHITVFVDGYADMAGPWSLSITRGAPDGGVSDGGVSDGAVSDGAVSDGAVSDGAVSDGATPADASADARVD